MSDSIFSYRWNLSDGYPAPGLTAHGHTVFGTFICGGGSSMGYKLAGYNHLGGVEIDKRVASIYEPNHSPQHLFVEDIRAFNQRKDLPEELFDLGILDGSPPCSSFSMSGNRDKDWGKKKVFREGQSEQRLDDLAFEYVKTIKKLQPKVAILENVKGLITGNAKAYSKRIHREFTKAGYRVQLFLLNAATMGVPQMRERVFFIGLRNDIDLPKLKLEYNLQPIQFGVIRKLVGGPAETNWTEHDDNIWKHRKYGDGNYGHVLRRIENRYSNFNAKFIYDEKVSGAIVSSDGSKMTLFAEKRKVNNHELKLIGSFPEDYDFKKMSVKYLIGMSVPPVMTAQIAHQIHEQWLSKI